jgi:Na+-transporting NADH:ubiquinone oxidoreductase subunit A
MQKHIRKESNLQPVTTRANTITITRAVRTSTFLGRDFPGSRLQVISDEGNMVKAGEPVLCDRRQPEILLTSPINGTVTAIHKGARRRLISLEITANGSGNGLQFEIPATLNQDSIRQLMLQSGLWATMRTRPFGYIPSPERNPKALFITAIDTQPLAPDPAVIISQFLDNLKLGIETLCDLVDAPVYLCKASDAEYQLDESCGVRVSNFASTHPAGLVGRHIHSLCPIGFSGDEVWHIDYQDVISLGQLISTGKPWHERIISLAGPAVKNPRLISVPLGAAIDEISVGELGGKSVRLISGSVLSGHIAIGHEASLGQRHRQVTALFEAATSRSEESSESLFYSGSGDEAHPLIPTTDLDNAAPPGILAVPLLRALIVGDVERARDLGALELVEEDLALLSYTCPSKTDYGALLRDMLDQIHREGLSTRG